MYTITKQIHFCYGHRLLNYDGPCRWLHGHNGLVEVELAAETLDERGMVCDFTAVKDILKAWIDEHLDHKMILHRADPLVSTLQESGEPLYLLEENPTAEAI
ncbi:MAG: 6-pyruvoyl tetrahydropterin synthase family protein, partial [Candidatus Tectimicrobiota bacterium]